MITIFVQDVPAVNSLAVDLLLAAVAETNDDICTFRNQPGKVVRASADCSGDPLVTKSKLGKC